MLGYQIPRKIGNYPSRMKRFVTCLSFSADDELIAAGTGRAIFIWDVKSLKCLGSLKNRSTVHSLCFTSKGYLAIGLEDGLVIRDPSSGEDIYPVKRTESPVKLIISDPRGDVIAAFEADGSGWVFLSDPPRVERLSSGNRINPIISFFHDESQVIAAISSNGAVGLWKWNGELIGVASPGEGGLQAISEIDPSLRSEAEMWLRLLRGRGEDIKIARGGRIAIAEGNIIEILDAGGRFIGAAEWDEAIRAIAVSNRGDKLAVGTDEVRIGSIEGLLRSRWSRSYNERRLRHVSALIRLLERRIRSLVPYEHSRLAEELGELRRESQRLRRKIEEIEEEVKRLKRELEAISRKPSNDDSIWGRIKRAFRR